MNEKTFGGQYRRDLGNNSTTMTMNGTVNKTAILLLLLVGGAVYPWYAVKQDPSMSVLALVLIGFIGGFIFALITMFKPNLSPYTAPAYAILEGIALGAISAMYDVRSNGIALQAMMLTVAVLFLMLFLYRMKIISVTQKFRMVVMCATGAIGALYLVSWILSFFSISIPFMHGSGLLSIGLSLVIVVVAALNLALDFDMIENGANSGAPKHMEWYGAFALLVTLVWLYLEMLRLLSKLKGRD
jgi:uncharacterized YccA/Bax inhibitor family protein